jgi:hypothetical protein
MVIGHILDWGEGHCPEIKDFKYISTVGLSGQFVIWCNSLLSKKLGFLNLPFVRGMVAIAMV